MSGHLPSLAVSGRAAGAWSWFQALVAMGAAGATLAIPGPTGEVCGIASILAVAALARLAGHSWGIGIAGVAATMQIAHVWPVVWTGQHSGLGAAAAVVSLSLSLLLAVGFAAYLPRRLPFLVGRFARGGAAGVGMSAAIVMLLLVLPAAVIRDTGAGAVARARTGKSAPVQLASVSGPASADRHAQAVPPGLIERVQRDLDGRGLAAARLDGDAKAIAADAPDHDESGAPPPDFGLDLTRMIFPVGHHEARGSLAEGELVDALSGAAWQTEIDAQRARSGDRALGQRHQ
jgi:hypothetical protein